MERTEPLESSNPQPEGAGGSLRAVADIVAVALAAVLTAGLAFAYGTVGGPAVVRVPLGFLFVFFCPGYAVTSALFPGTAVDGSRSGRATVDAVERVVLSVGLSLALVPLVGIGLTLVSVPVGLVSLLGSVAAVTVGAGVVGAVRRLDLPPYRRFYPSLGARAGLDYAAASRTNLAVAVVVVLATAGVGLAVATPGSDERYTEFGLLAPGEGGDGTAADYPTEFEVGESRALVAEVGNHEGRETTYTGVILLERPTASSDRETASRSVELDRFQVTVADGERLVYEHDVRPTGAGEDLRLTYLLYRGEAPAEPTPANAYRRAHLGVDVAEPDG